MGLARMGGGGGIFHRGGGGNRINRNPGIESLTRSRSRPNKYVALMDGPTRVQVANIEGQHKIVPVKWPFAVEKAAMSMVFKQ